MKKFSIPFRNNPFLKLLLVIAFSIFAAFFIPVMGSFFLLILPMILFFNGTVNGINKTAAAFLISFSLFLLLAMMLSIHVPAIPVFAMAAAGLLMAQIAAGNVSVEKTIIYPAVFIIAAICFYFIYDGFVHSADPWLLVKNYIAAIIAENVKFYSQLPLKAEDINFIKDNEKNIVSGITQIFPALVVISAVFIVWINFLLGKNYLGKAGITYHQFTALTRWKAPDFTIWIFIASAALFLISHQDINLFGWNIFLVVCFIYFLQGLTIVSFFFQTKNVPFFFRYFFYFLIAVQQILMVPIAAVGCLDIWIDFRKLFQKDQTAA
ncbi:MAG: hypothetical protein CVU55_14915 [Deltaproteobacteria bacterium HGW-Deltaproteobacteria-13]|nr:MAG: hypothetical protein CVU55_14915 [Deltaproteobacteria bacterium HGW-Deltaproteobacteria-13]